MGYEYIEEKDAPNPPKPVNKSTAKFLEILEGLEKRKVAKVEPEPGQSLRGMKVSFGRLASNRGMNITTWSVEGDDHLYVKRND